MAPGVLLAGVAGGIAFPILPIVGLQSGLPLPFIGAILAANRAMRVVSSPLVGAFSDKFGGRRTLIAGLVLQCGVMLLYTLGITTGHPGVFFLAGRMLHGPGSACVFVAGQALALHAGGKLHGGRAAATVRAAMSLGIPVGLVAGGVLADRWGNAATFESALGGVALATLVAWWLVPDLRVPLAKKVGFSKLWREMTNRRLLSIGALNFAAAFSAQGMVLTTLTLVVGVRHVSLLGFGDKGSSGVLMGLMCVVMAAFMPLAGRLGDRYRIHAPIALGGLVALVPSLVLVALAQTTLGLAGGLAIMGIAVGALSPSLLALVGDITTQESRGTAVGVLQLCGDVGGTLGPLLGTALFAGSLRAPYFASAILLACFIPLGVGLLRPTGAQAR
ncbi:MAG: MFS transporter [Myxococcales bacterium]